MRFFTTIVVLLLVGCSDDTIVYEQADMTFTIVRRSSITPADYAVIHVYGFSGNEEVTQELVDYLNKKEPNHYYYIIED